MVKKVFVVTKDYYSDYHIVGVFSRKIDAQRMIAQAFPIDPNHDETHISGEEPTIEEYDLDLYVLQLRKGFHYYLVEMERNGENKIEKSTPGEEETYWQYSGKGFELGANMIIGGVWAANEQHAAKIANEKRIQLIEAGEWPE